MTGPTPEHAVPTPGADQDAFRRLYEEWADRVHTIALHFTHDEAAAQDVTQQVFLKIMGKLDSFRGDARLSTWLYRICINVALGKIRSRSRRPPPVAVADVGDLADARAVATGDRAETPERALERAQDRQRVYRALDQLPPKKRIVLFLHEIEGLDLKEIAYLVDSNAVTVRTRLFYARREFYKLLAQETEEDAS
jgi:RNA polymerase sigma-70 factor (ECF subfamily)